MFIQDVENQENGLIALLPAKRTKHYKNQKVIMKMIVGSSNIRFLYSLQMLENLFLDKSIDLDSGILEIEGIAVCAISGNLHIECTKQRKSVELLYANFYQAVNEFVQQDRKERINLKKK